MNWRNSTYPFWPCRHKIRHFTRVQESVRNGRKKRETRLNNTNGVNGWLLLCVLLMFMSIAVRTNLSCRPWELVHFWRARTFWPVLTLGQTVKGLMFEGLGLVLWVNVRNGFRFSLGLRLGFGIMLVSVLTRIEVQTWWLHIWAQKCNYVSKCASLCRVMLAFTLLADIVLGGRELRVTARMDTDPIQSSSAWRLPFRAHWMTTDLTKQQHSKWIIFWMEVDPKAEYIVDSSSETSAFGKGHGNWKLKQSTLRFFHIPVFPKSI